MLRCVDKICCSLNNIDTLLVLTSYIILKIIVLKFVTLSRFGWLSATDERHVCEFSCTCYLYAAQQPVCEFSWYLNWSFSGISQTHRSFCRISLFLITLSPKNSMTNSTANNSTQQLTVYIQNHSLFRVFAGHFLAVHLEII